MRIDVFEIVAADHAAWCGNTLTGVFVDNGIVPGCAMINGTLDEFS